MAFDEIQMDPAITYGARGGPIFSTTVVMTDSGSEQRIQHWSYPRRRWNLETGIKTNAQMQSLVAFFIARQGRSRGFRFKDWLDYKITDKTDAVELTGTTFQIVKEYVSGAITNTRNITKPVAGTVKVWNGAAEITTGWTVDTTTGIITFDSNPAYTPSVTCQFDTPVRFDMDAMETSMDAFNTNNWSNITVVEILI